MSFNLIKVNELVSTQPENQWLIEGIVEKDCLAMFFGKPASAKSFLGVDIAYCVASGIDWNGYPTAQGKVVYIAGEGFNGLSKRFKALSVRYSNAVPDDLFISTMPASLSEVESAEEVKGKIDSLCSEPRLIIIDTFNRNFGGGDENSARDISSFLMNIDMNLKHTGATILIIHHSGHNNTERSRGSTAIKGALDAEYQISKSADVVTMKCTKAKDHEEADEISFKLVTQEIPDWLDDNGNALKSAILESTTATASPDDIAITGHLKTVYDSLKEVIEIDGESLPQSILDASPELTGVQYVNMQRWKDKVYLALGDRTDETKQRTFNRAKETLLNDLDRVVIQDDKCWINE